MVNLVYRELKKFISRRGREREDKGKEDVDRLNEALEREPSERGLGSERALSATPRN